MKKSISIICIFVALTSCKKYYTCECTTNSTAVGSTLKKETIHTSKMTKKQAEKGPCAFTSTTSNGVTQNKSCVILE